MDTSHYKQKLHALREEFLIVYRSLSPEKVLFIMTFLAFSIIFFFTAFVIFNQRFLKTVPDYGGTIREGIVGTPRFINPVLATSEQDKDLTALIFSGLTKHDETGSLILDMASSITESDDSLRYTATLKEGARFHDGKKVTADDIIYTINVVQNPLMKSPHRVEWEGVSVE